MCDLIKDSNLIALLTLLIAGLGLIISVVVLLITLKAYLLKRGQSVRGWIGTSSSFESEESYIRSITIENLKDRELVISEIYVRFGQNIYIDMFNKDGLYDNYIHIIPPFSYKEFLFGPPLVSIENNRIEDISKLIQNRKLKKKIVLSTNRGKLIVKEPKKGWAPIVDYFRNYGTIIIKPIRYYKDDSIHNKNSISQVQSAINYTSYGNRTLYLVKIRRRNQGLITYPVYETEKVFFFERLNFTKKALSSKEHLSTFISKAKKSGIIDFEEIEEIIDVRSFVQELKSDYSVSKTPLIAENFFQYQIVDKCQTIWYKFIQSSLGKRIKGVFYKTNDKTAGR